MPGGRDRRGGGGGGLLGKLAGGVGLAAEAIQHQRNKSKSPQPDQASSASHVGNTQAPPFQATENTYGQDPAQQDLHADYEDESFTREDGVTKHDQAIWELDEAADEVDTSLAARKAVIPKYFANEPANISKLVNAFVSVHAPVPHQGPAELPAPVVIPQKRPEARARGFVRAYSPYLDICGIGEDTFMQFLDFYDESLQYSNVIRVFQVAGGIVGLVPSAACMAVSHAIQAGTKIAAQAQTKQRSNDFVARMNQQYFLPMGLVCLVLKFSPRSGTSQQNLQPAISNATQKLHTNFDAAHGTINDMELPEVAPLVFPALDKSEDKEKLSKFQRTKQFVADYQDRRAHAQFQVNNPDSSLAATMQAQTTFESSLADPRQTGGLRDIRGSARAKISEYTGLAGGRRPHDDQGRRHHDDQGRRRNNDQGRRRNDDQGRFGQDRRGLRSHAGGVIGRRSEQRGERRNARDNGGRQRGRSGVGPVGLISKALQEGVLYMMISPMPSDEEMAQVVSGSTAGVELVDVSL